MNLSQSTEPEKAVRRVAVTGSSGLVGTELTKSLTEQGHGLLRVVRREPVNTEEIAWSPERGTIDATRLEGVDAVVHLAGEGIANRRWSAQQKERIRQSRQQGTTLLCHTLAQLKKKPRVLVSASAIGYYGNRGDETLDESSSLGEGFLANVCHQWEASTQAATDAGIRVVNARLGVVLSSAGGALKKMLLPFQLGLGGRIGNGHQMWSWVSIDDVVGGILHAIDREEIVGAMNVVSPEPVSNRQFTKTLGKVLRRPTIFPLPRMIARLVLGEMAVPLLLASARVMPSRLQASGYEFQHDDLEEALRFVLSAQ